MVEFCYKLQWFWFSSASGCKTRGELHIPRASFSFRNHQFWQKQEGRKHSIEGKKQCQAVRVSHVLIPAEKDLKIK